MKFRVFIVVALSLFYFCSILGISCQGSNLNFKGQSELKNLSEMIPEGTDYYSSNHLITYLINLQAQHALTTVNESIQDGSGSMRTKSRQYDNILIYTSTLIIILGLGFVFFRIIDHKNKQLIALKQNEVREQIIKELKIDHQLLAARAVLTGEEQERGRISRDLHDGLGGMLAGIKLALSGIKNNKSFPVEMDKEFDLIQTQLNASISELRMIAQNLMPEALMNFGLKEALNDFCTNLGGNKSIEISFLFYGEPFRFDNSIETSLFRIAQESVNNALKHARASQIIVQLIQDENWVNLTIQDNGQGFDPHEIKEKKNRGIEEYGCTS